MPLTSFYITDKDGNYCYDSYDNYSEAMRRAMELNGDTWNSHIVEKIWVLYEGNIDPEHLEVYNNSLQSLKEITLEKSSLFQEGNSVRLTLSDEEYFNLIAQGVCKTDDGKYTLFSSDFIEKIRSLAKELRFVLDNSDSIDPNNKHSTYLQNLKYQYTEGGFESSLLRMTPHESINLIHDLKEYCSKTISEFSFELVKKPTTSQNLLHDERAIASAEKLDDLFKQYIEKVKSQGKDNFDIWNEIQIREYNKNPFSYFTSGPAGFHHELITRHFSDNNKKHLNFIIGDNVSFSGRDPLICQATTGQGEHSIYGTIESFSDNKAIVKTINASYPVGVEKLTKTSKEKTIHYNKILSDLIVELKDKTVKKDNKNINPMSL